MNDEVKKLYDLLVREGKYTKSFDEFQSQWSDNAYKEKVYGVVSRDGFYTKDMGSFMQKYGGQPILEEKQEQEQETAQEPVKKKEVTPMASSSGATSLDSQEEPTRITDYLQTKEEPTPQAPVPYQVGKEPKPIIEEEQPFLKPRGKEFANLRVPTEEELAQEEKKAVKGGELAPTMVSGKKTITPTVQYKGSPELTEKEKLFKTERGEQYEATKREKEQRIKNYDLYDPEGRVSPLGNRTVGAQDEKNIKRETELNKISNSFDNFKEITAGKKLDEDAEAKNFYLYHLQTTDPDEYKYQIERIEYNKDNQLQRERIEVDQIRKGLLLKQKALSAKAEQAANSLSDQFFGYKTDVEKYMNVNNDIKSLTPKIELLGNELSKYPKDENGNIIIDETNKKKVEKLQSLYNEGTDRYNNLINERDELLKSGLGSVIDNIQKIQDEETKNYEYAKNLTDKIINTEKYPELRKELFHDIYTDLEQEVMDENVPEWMKGTGDIVSGLNKAGTSLLKGLAFLPKLTGNEKLIALAAGPIGWAALPYIKNKKSYDWTDRWAEFSDEYITELEKVVAPMSANAKKNIFDYERDENGNPILDKNGNKKEITNWSALPYQVSNGAGNLLLFMGSGGVGTTVRGVSLLGKVGMAEKALSTAATFAMGYTLAAKNNYDEAIQNGLSESDAIGYSKYKSIIDGGVELIFPEESLLTPTVNKEVAKKTAEYISKGIPLKDAVINASTELLKKVGGENVEELTGIASDYFSKVLTQKATGTDFKVDDGLMNEIKNTVLVTSILTAPFGIVGAAGSKNQIENQSLFIAANKPNDVLKSISELLNSKVITDNQARTATQRIRLAEQELKSIPEDYSDDKKASILSGLVDKKILEDKKKGIDPLFHENIDNQIKEKDEELKKEISRPDNGLTSEQNEQLNSLTKKQEEGKVLTQEEKKSLDYLTNFTKEYAVQEQAAGQVPVQPTTGVGKEMEGGEPTTKPEVVTEEGITDEEKVKREKLKENRRVDLFPEQSEFANVIGNSGTNSNLSSYNEVNGIGIASYTNPDNGLVDVIMSGTSDNDYVGFVRIYENGKPTNRFTSKMSNESGNKENFKTMISETQSLLPANHEYTETTNISLDGVRVFSNQLNRGYEVATDENGNVITNNVTLNRATVEGLREAQTQQEKEDLYNNLTVNTQEEFNKIKEKINSLLPNTRVLWNQANNTVQIALPVLKSTKVTEEVTAPTVTTEEAVTYEVPQEEMDAIEKRRQEKLDAVDVAKGGKLPIEGYEAYYKKVTDEYNQEVDALKKQYEEAAKFERELAGPVEEARFMLAEEERVEPITNTEDIEKEMNSMPEAEINFTEPSVSQKGLKVNPVEESNSTVKIPKEEADKLLKPIQEFNGIPVIMGMSDMLAAGKIKDSAGNDMDVEGGLLFNVLGKNKNAAWAGVTKDGAQAQYDNAVKLYEANKELFDRLWAEGKLPNGHVPMAIMRMSDTAVNSNEAVFRWVLPTIESLPKENRVKAMDAFVASMNEKLNTKADAEKAKKILDFIKEKNIKSLDQFFKEIISDANKRAKGSQDAKLNLDHRSLIYDSIFAPSGIKTASKPTIKALLSGTDNSKNKIFTSDFIYKSIGEPSMLKSKQGEVVAIVGIDVKNGGVVNVEHGNYGFGPKGKMIALIENPMHGTDVFPEFKAKAARVFKETKAGKLPTEEAVAQQTGGAFFTDKAFRGTKVSAGVISDINLLIGKLRFAFPTVSVSTSKEEFDNVIKSPDVRTRVSEGKIIYGLTKDGKIYLNPEIAALQTPIHEFGHIWIDFLRSKASGDKGTQLLNKGLKLVRGTEAHKKAVEMYGDTELALEEALVELMANKGASIIDAAKKSKFKSWLNAVFKYIKEKFTRFKDFNEKKIAKMKLDDFINIGLADLFSGEEVSAKFAPETTETAMKARLSASKDLNDIIKKGRASGYSDAAIKIVLKKKGFTDAEVNAAMETEKGAAKKVTVSEEMLPGFDRMMEQVEGIVTKSKERGVSEEKIADNVMKYVMGSKAYENATDVQREQIIRDIEKKFGIKQKPSPKAEKIIGIKEPTKITVSEKDALKNQIKSEAKGAKNAVSAWRKASAVVSKMIKDMRKSGKITTTQAANVLRKFSSVNVLSSESIGRYIDYMGKVFADAEYANKLSVALESRKAISKLSKNKDKDANLRALGEKFKQIDPAMVDDIDAYNEMASIIKESIKGSTYRGGVVMPAQMVNVNEAMDYTEKIMKAQDKKMAELKAAEIQELMGVDASDLSYEQMLKLLESKEPITKYNEGIIRDTINRMFDVYSAMIDSMIETGIDPMTGDDIDLKVSQKQLIKKFMEMDLNKLTPKEALQAVDALNNFMVNKSTAKMETVVREYTGDTNAKKLADKGIKSKPLQMYWIKSVGRFFGEQFASLPSLIERMFKGVMAGSKIENASGLTDIKNGKADAETKSNKIVEEYVDKFYKQKANGEAFNTEANVVERGMTAFMSRSLTGTEEQIQQDFNRRKKLIEESINALSKGSEKERQKAELYKAAYEKILKDANSVAELRKNVDKKNLEAVDFWVDKWSSIYDQLSDVSQNVYNKILDKDSDYTPDRFTRLETAQEKIDLDSDQSIFHGNTNTLYKKETGVLMKAERPESLPKDDKGKKPMMYIDLSFDKNNANSMYDALVDINTAGPIRQVQAFLNSEGFDQMVPEVKDAKLLKDRIQLYVRNIRNKNVFDNDEMSAMVRKLNTISAIGVGQALGGILQPLKQTIPVAMNTLVNAKGLDIGSIFSSAKMNFIDNSGYAIANRGIESQTQLKSINKLMDLAAESKGIKVLKYIEQANKIWLDIFLVKPDSFVARASWMSYYEQSLKKQGIDPSGIDYNTHKINKEAADYAQTMVDRQQNISDADLQGKMFASKTPLSQIFVKTLLPFANFRMNQFMRLTNDITTLTSMTSSKEDRAIAAWSLGGYSVEVATFTMISTAATMLLYELSKGIMGEDEDEEEEERRISNMIKGQMTGRVTDILSPIPFLDKPIAAGVNMAMDKVQEAMDIAKEERLSIYGDTKVDMVKSLGTLGIAAERAAQLYDLYDLASTGEYTDSYGNTKKISENSRAYLEGMTAVALLTNIGLAPSEANNVVRNSIKIAKSTGKTQETIEKEIKTEENKTESRLLLNELRQTETDPDIIDAIDKRIIELESSSEEMKEKRKFRKEEKQKLLQGYKSMDEMKRYDPKLYEENFGKGSDFYEKYKDEVLLNKAYNKLERKIKDEEMEYIPKPKKNKKQKGFLGGGFKSEGFNSKGFESKGF